MTPTNATPMPLAGGDYIQDESGLKRVEPSAKPAAPGSAERATVEPAPARLRTRANAPTA